MYVFHEILYGNCSIAKKFVLHSNLLLLCKWWVQYWKKNDKKERFLL